MERDYVRHESERTGENIVKEYLNGGQSIKWAGGMLEFCCSSELLRKNHEMREKEVLRIIEKYGKGTARTRNLRFQALMFTRLRF